MANRPSRPRSVPHLRLNRCGVWCFRLTVCGRAVQRSLGTKDKALANMLASRLNWEWAITKRGNEPTIADRFDIEAYGKKVGKAAAEEVFRQFKPLQQQAKAVPKLRKQIEEMLAEMAQLRESIAALKGQRDFFAKALALILGFEPDLNTQQGMTKTVAAVKEARRQLRGEPGPPPAPEPAPEAPRIDPNRSARSPNRKPRGPRAPRPGHGPIQ